MPVYPVTKTYKSGFHNNHVVNGVNDRVYTAKDLREPYNTVFSDGVKPNANGVIGTDLQVQAVSGFQINVAAGRGLFGGAFFYNQASYTITLDAAESTDRYDAVIVKADDTDAVRLTNIYIKSLYHAPNINDLTRNDNVKEYCLGYVKVTAFATEITQSNITDTRANQNLCGVITGVFNQFDGAAMNVQFETAFNEWFSDVKDSFLSSATLIRAYTNDYITQTANVSVIPIGIPQYNRNIDTLMVYINGGLLPSSRFTINSNSQVTLSIALPVVGTRVTFEVWKSVDGSGAQTVVSEVGELQTWRNDVSKVLQYHYYCNGQTDNVTLSNLITDLYDSADLNENAQIEIKVYGNTFGFSTWHGVGTGTASSRFKFLRVGKQTAQTKKIVIDFSNCSTVNMVCDDGAKYFGLFYGYNARIKNGKFNISGNGNVMLFNAGDDIECENCEFYINVSGEVLGLTSGALKAKYRNCRVSCASATNNVYGAYLYSGEYLELNSTVLMAFKSTASTDKQSCGVYVEPSASYAPRTLLKMTDCNLPQVDRTGYEQEFSVKINNYAYYSMLGNTMFTASTKVASITGAETNSITLNRAM